MAEAEVWKSLDGFSGYKFSNTGKVWSNHYKKELINKPKKDGYIRLMLLNDKQQKKSYALHRLIASTFIPNLNNKPTVNHINHNPSDNRVINLEWATYSEQNNHSRQIPLEKSRLSGANSVWRCNLKGEKIEFFQSMTYAGIWVFNNELTDYKEFNSVNKKRITANIGNVCREK